MGIYEKSKGNSNLVNFFIGLALVAFVVVGALVVAGIVISVLLMLIPLAAIAMVIGGGIWFFRAKNDHYRMRAGMTFFVGVLLLIIF